MILYTNLENLKHFCGFLSMDVMGLYGDTIKLLYVFLACQRVDLFRISYNLMYCVCLSPCKFLRNRPITTVNAQFCYI